MSGSGDDGGNDVDNDDDVMDVLRTVVRTVCEEDDCAVLSNFGLHKSSFWSGLWTLDGLAIFSTSGEDAPMVKFGDVLEWVCLLWERGICGGECVIVLLEVCNIFEEMGGEQLLRGDCGDLGGVLEYMVWDVGIEVGEFF